MNSPFCLKQLVGIILCMLFLPSAAQAASFDCSKAASDIEKIICNDDELSKLDESLEKAYLEALKRANIKEETVKSQKQWLKYERNTCKDVECIKKAYETRIKELLSEKETESLQTRRSDLEACRVVADYSNRGIFDEIFVQRFPIPPEEELERIFGKNTLWGSPSSWRYTASYWHIDLDNDGIPDQLIITKNGTMRASHGFVRSGKNGATVKELGDSKYIDLDVLNVNGRYYILSYYGGYRHVVDYGGPYRCGEQELGNLWRLAKDGDFMPVCGFTPRKKPIVELVEGKENSVCLEVDRGRIQHITYPLMHAFESLPSENRFWSKHPIDGLAQVDIDNDGKVDNVIRIDFSHGGGRGCDSVYLAVTDDTRTNIPDSKLNDLLLEKLGGYPCGPNLDAFVYQGTTYVDAWGDAGNRKIYRIRGEHAETICTFCGRCIHDVADAVERSEE